MKRNNVEPKRCVCICAQTSPPSALHLLFFQFAPLASNLCMIVCPSDFLKAYRYVNLVTPFKDKEGVGMVRE